MTTTTLSPAGPDVFVVVTWALLALLVVVAFLAGRRYERRQEATLTDGYPDAELFFGRNRSGLISDTERAALAESSRRMSAAFDELPEVRQPDRMRADGHFFTDAERLQNRAAAAASDGVVHLGHGRTVRPPQAERLIGEVAHFTEDDVARGYAIVSLEEGERLRREARYG